MYNTEYRSDVVGYQRFEGQCCFHLQVEVDITGIQRQIRLAEIVPAALLRHVCSVILHASSQSEIRSFPQVFVSFECQTLVLLGCRKMLLFNGLGNVS